MTAPPRPDLAYSVPMVTANWDRLINLTSGSESPWNLFSSLLDNVVYGYISALWPDLAKSLTMVAQFLFSFSFFFFFSIERSYGINIIFNNDYTIYTCIK